MKIFVIAGTVHEARRWANANFQKRAGNGERNASMNDYVLVSSAWDLKGYQDPHGVFVGNWLGRPDIFDIVQGLMIASLHVNRELQAIYSQVKPKVRPTPKQPPLHKVSGGYALAVDDAALAMAQAIDEMVIKNLAKRINGGII